MKVRLNQQPRSMRQGRPLRSRMGNHGPWSLLALATVSLMVCGCQSIFSPISGVPAHRLPPEFLALPKNNLIPIDIARLRQEPPREYQLDAGDVLGIYIEGVLGDAESLPPVHFPEASSDLPPASGYPVPIREDGTLSLPLVPPIAIRGLTLSQAEDAIRRAYTVERNILVEGKDRIIVTRIRDRTYSVIVMRQDGVAGTSRGQTRGVVSELGTLRGSEGETIRLPAYKNDVLHALAATGGLPGPEVKNEIYILRGTNMDFRARDEFVRQFYADKCKSGPCLCHPPLPDDPAIIRIPLRLPPGEVPTFDPEDVILQDGDIVLLESRETEVFYTGGLLGPGEYPMPRDYDIDVLTALSVTGPGIAGNVGRGMRGGGMGGGGMMGGNMAMGLGGVPPGDLYILRRTPCGGQVIIKVDMNRAIRDPRSRPLVQAGDVLILRFKPEEEIFNFGIGTFFTFGIRELLRR
jgi:hypothetical protein